MIRTAWSEWRQLEGQLQKRRALAEAPGDEELELLQRLAICWGRLTAGQQADLEREALLRLQLVALGRQGARPGHEPPASEPAPPTRRSRRGA
jgi:hypothetical protein